MTFLYSYSILNWNGLGPRPAPSTYQRNTIFVFQNDNGEQISVFYSQLPKLFAKYYSISAQTSHSNTNDPNINGDISVHSECEENDKDYTIDNRNLDSSSYSNNVINGELAPNFVTGFTDAEGCFRISLTKRAKGWRVQLFFQITLHKKDKALLESIKRFFGVGQINISGKNLLQYRVQNFKELAIIINHFTNFPLITQKFADFILFKKAYELIISKQHLTHEGLLKIVSLKASINLGLSNTLKVAFPNIIPALRSIPSTCVPDNHWLSGFASGEACFLVGLSKSLNSLTGFQVSLTFILTQHVRDELLMKNLIKFLGCGRLSLKKNVYELQVSRFSDVKSIINFFFKYPILGEKSKDFNDFVRVFKMMESKSHLTNEGVATIRKIKDGMNRKR